jgi:hypothetical protein
MSEINIPDEAAAQRIFNSFVGGAARGFGPEPLAESTAKIAEQLGLGSPSIYGDALRKSGFWNDYAKGQHDARKEFMETTFKATVGTLATTIRAGEAALSAPIEVISQFMEQYGLLTKEDVEGALGDPGLAMLYPPGTTLNAMVVARRAANLRVTIPRARAAGIIAEGEEGAFEAVPLTPENARARAEAAKEAGIPTPVPEQVAPDVHVLARRIDPPVFESYDILEEVKGAHRTTIQTLAAAREALPEAVQAQDEIRTILGKVHGVEERLTKAARARLETAQANLDRVLSSDTPEMAKARKALLSADIAQRDLVPAVASAYRQAREMMPPPVERVAEVVEEISAGKPIAQVNEGASPPTTATQTHLGDVDRIAAERVDPAQTPRAAAPTRTGLRPIEGTGPLRTRGLSEGIEARAVEAELVKSFGDLPEYHTLSMADQAQKAIEYAVASPEDALKVAMGQKAAPKGISPASIFVVVEKQARAAGEWETLRDLATVGGMPGQATEAGRFIRIFGERDAGSPVGAMHAIQEARRAALEKRNATAIRDATKEIKAEMRRAAPKRDVWAQFIDTLPVCD